MIAGYTSGSALDAVAETKRKGNFLGEPFSWDFFPLISSFQSP